MQENFEIVQKGFRTIHPLFAAYIAQSLQKKYGDKWWQEVLYTLSDQIRDLPENGNYAELVDSLDIANCLRLIDRKWRDVFKFKLNMNYKTWATELMGVRNNIAHIGTQDMDKGDAERALDTMARLATAFDDEVAEELRGLLRKLRYGDEAGSNAAKPVAATGMASSAAVLTTNVGNRLPSWREVMQPHADVAEGRYHAAEFAADLAQVARNEGSIEYRDPVEFFSRTYITVGMENLLIKSLQRLAGKGGEPVIQLKTAFGGGKTHSMLALYHIAKGGVPVNKMTGLQAILDKAEIENLPKANVAVLVGTAMDPTKKKLPPNLPGHTVNTIWGEMAYQLVVAAGKPDLYEIIKESDKKGVSPGSEKLKMLLDACAPCVVLMDELVAYAKKIYGVSGLPAGSFDNFITFIQEITEAARASKNSLVVASIPESNIEIGEGAGTIALESIEHTFGRMESVWKPVAADEGFEIVRRRLFLDCNYPEQRELVCKAFSEMYQQNANDFPFETKELTYKNRLLSCYPIHPEVFDRLYNDWATLERFQRTRGVLRLMAAVIHELWMANDAGAMIMPSSLPLDMENVKNELVRHLPDTWNSIIDHEVDGKNSVPYQKDKEYPRYGACLACRRVARTIMLGSAPTVQDQSIRGLETNRIRLGVVQPGENISNFNDALTTLHGALAYLYNNSTANRYWFDTRPTLKKTAEDRASQVPDADVEMEIEARLKKLKREEPLAGVHTCPNTSIDVPDEQSTRLVIFKPRDFYKKGASDNAAHTFAEEILNSRGDNPRIYKNTLAFVAADWNKLNSLKQEIKRYHAWKSILDDKEDLNLDVTQIREATNNISRCNDTVDIRLKETYCWLLVPYIDKEEDIKTMLWEEYDLGGGDVAIVTKAVRKMVQAEQIISKWSPALLTMVLDELLWKNTNHVQIKKVWDCLTTYCYMPRLARYDVLENSIRDGLTSEDFFAIAVDFDGERYKGLHYQEPVLSINNTDYLVKPLAATKQLLKEKNSGEGASGGTPNGGEGTGGASGGLSGGTGSSGGSEAGGDTPQEKIYTHFYLSAPIDTIRINKNVNDLVNNIIQHLMNVEGSQIDIKLEIQADSPNGYSKQVQRIVSENCNALKYKDFSFEE